LACALQKSVKQPASKKLKIVDIVSIRSTTTKGTHLDTLAIRQQSSNTQPVNFHIPIALSTWPNNSCSAVPSRVTPAGSPAWPPLWRSKRWQCVGNRIWMLMRKSPNMLLSASRDKSLIIWNLTRDDTSYGYAKRSLHGHSHIVSDCVCLYEKME